MGWGDKLNQITKSAVSKSKEMAEITRLNIENSNSEQKIKELAVQIGMLVADDQLLMENAQVAEWIAQIAALRANIAKNQETIHGIRNIDICTSCGTEVSRTSKFCAKCGSPMERSVLEDSIASVIPTCPKCSEQLEPGALFCGNCGAKFFD